MGNFKFFASLILFSYLLAISASATTLLLTGAGTGAPAGGGGGCTNSLDFSQACNSQYIGTF